MLNSKIEDHVVDDPDGAYLPVLGYVNTDRLTIAFGGC